MSNRIRYWLAAHPNWVLAGLVFATLAPFLARPFNMDEPLFIWAAKQIQAHPANPYGFDVNWYGFTQPMWSVMENPPLVCGFIALAAKIFGWGETGLHLAFVLPAVAVILGTYRLAKRFCRQPLLAALATLFTPVFMMSANTVMCDVMLLAFWVWAVVFWIEGLAQNNLRRLLISGAMMSLAMLTKYYGLCLIPLLAVHGLIHHRRAGRWIFALLLPVVTLLVYELFTLALYNHGLFSAAASYTVLTRGKHAFSLISTGLVGLAFTGGCFAPAVIFAPLVWRFRMLLAFGGVALAFAFVSGAALMENYGSLADAARTSAEIQTIFWAAGGASVLALTVAGFYHQRDADTLLLVLWVLGTFIFACFFNWTINGRSLLPAMPAIAILLVRRLDQRNRSQARAVWLLAASAVLALLVAGSDYSLAWAVRQSARQTWVKYGKDQPALWFQGHWGYQYYLEALGASAVDLANSPLQTGDTLALPWNNTNIRLPKSEFAAPVETLTISKAAFFTTMDGDSGAGFYGSGEGPLPFVFCQPPAEQVLIFRLKELVSDTTSGQSSLPAGSP